MKKTKLPYCTLKNIPTEISEFLIDADIYDSSSSPEARVYYIDKGVGYFLKTADKEVLKTEALMTDFFHSKKIAPRLISYVSSEKDWILTEKLSGEDATDAEYLKNPKRLVDKMAEILRELHGMNFVDCPIKDRLADYFLLVEENFKRKKYDLSFSKYKTPEEAYRVAKSAKEILKNDCLIHGDFCLPNYIFNNWNFQGFIDLGNSGVGDRHIDIFWGIWTLNYNLKTNAYMDRFIDAYGKEKINKDALAAVSACEVFG